MIYRPITHVIFDMDGLILDTESSLERIITKIARSYGKEYTLPIKLKVLGTVENDTAKICIENMNLPLTVDEFLHQYHEGMNEELQRPPFLHGAAELIRHLHKNNIPIALATSSTQESTRLKTQYHQKIFNLFHHKVCGSTDPDVKKGKPSPDIFLVAASRFPDKPSPSQCLVFEDAPNGVKAAITAGMQAVMVPNEDVAPKLRKDATLVLESLADFKPELFGLPAYN